VSWENYWFAIGVAYQGISQIKSDV